MEVREPLIQKECQLKLSYIDRKISKADSCFLVINIKVLGLL